MPSVTDFPARGDVLSVQTDSIVFAPAGTNYQLRLEGTGFDGPLNSTTELFIRLQARKIWTVPSGGGFIQPIFGPPRIVQGRIKYLSDKEMVVRAGTHFIVSLPTNEDAYDLARGELAVGSMVNVTALPGAVYELPVSQVAQSGV
jgi:hypothetical protein